MVSQGMGNLTTAKLYDIRKNENMTTFLTNVGPDFYTEVRFKLNSMMNVRDGMVGESRNNYSKTVCDSILTVNDIMFRRLGKIFDMVIEEQSHNSRANFTQTTPEEERIFKTLSTTIQKFRTNGGVL